MADVLERAERVAFRRDPRETLEPMLDDLMRGLGYDKALLLLYDDERAALVGSFGIGVKDEDARTLALPLGSADDPIVAVLRGGHPQRLRDATTDERLAESTRHVLAKVGMGPLVAAPLRSTNERGFGSDGKGPAPVWDTRSEWAGVVLLSRHSGVSQSDVEALAPFARQAGEALSLQREVQLLQETSEAHAIEKEWLWWMVNGVGDAVLVTDSNNDIILQNRRAELLFRASEADSAGKRRAVWMNNFLFTAALSTWNLERGPATKSREVTLVRRLESAEEEVRTERDRLDLILRNVPNPIIVVDNDNQIISMNPAASRLFRADSAGRRGAAAALANETRFTSFLARLRLDPASWQRGEILLTDPDN